jgi:glycerol kinase
MANRCVMALDQGTTSSRAILFRHDGTILATAQQEFQQIFPQPGHVEHDAEEIWSTQLAVGRQVLADAKVAADEVAAIGVTNQRETTVLWNRDTGRPVANAIVWQSRLTAEMCQQLKADGLEPLVRDRTGLVLDAYFSGTKIKHLLDSYDGLRDRAGRGEILFGTIDTFLLWRLTGGKRHVTDYSNASRTMIFNIHSLDWDDELLAALDIPRAMLPEVRPSSEVYGQADPEWFGAAIPIAGDAGDQQAATFGQACFEAGTAKNTYGTGAFILMNTGTAPVASDNGLLTTIGWGLDGSVTYCLEGSVFVAGAAVQWLRDQLQMISGAAETEALAASEPDNGGVYFVPAFVGLGAPHWDPQARGLLIGLTRGTSRGHIARAALESMAYQSLDVLSVMEKDSGQSLTALKVDGGASANNLLIQFQADLLDTAVHRPVVQETTALGAAYLAGLAVGFWDSTTDVADNWKLDREFQPDMKAGERDRLCQQWNRAVERSKAWAAS